MAETPHVEVQGGARRTKTPFTLIMGCEIYRKHSGAQLPKTQQLSEISATAWAKHMQLLCMGDRHDLSGFSI